MNLGFDVVLDADHDLALLLDVAERGPRVELLDVRRRRGCRLAAAAARILVVAATGEHEAEYECQHGQPPCRSHALLPLPSDG